MTKNQLLELVDNLINDASNLSTAKERSDGMYLDQKINDLEKKLIKSKENLIEILEAIRPKEYKDL